MEVVEHFLLSWMVERRQMGGCKEEAVEWWYEIKDTEKVEVVVDMKCESAWFR